jgi:hypothetical protein
VPGARLREWSNPARAHTDGAWGFARGKRSIGPGPVILGRYRAVDAHPAQYRLVCCTSRRSPRSRSPRQRRRRAWEPGPAPRAWLVGAARHHGPRTSEQIGTQRDLPHPDAVVDRIPHPHPRHIVVAVGNARQILEWAADIPRINDVEDSLANACSSARPSPSEDADKNVFIQPMCGWGWRRGGMPAGRRALPTLTGREASRASHPKAVPLGDCAAMGPVTETTVLA